MRNLNFINSKRLVVYRLIALMSLLLSTALLSCKPGMTEKAPDESPPGQVREATLQGKLMKVELYRDPFKLQVADNSGKTLLETSDVIRFTTVTNVEVKEKIAWYFFSKGDAEPWTSAGVVKDVKKTDSGLDFSLASNKTGKNEVKWHITFRDDKSLRVEIEVLDRPEVNRLSVSFASNSSDKYFGMGERYYSAEHSGRVVRNWTEEGGIGVGGLSKVAPNLSWNPYPHGQDTTYFAVPFFLNTRGYGFLLDDTHYAEFDFGKTQPGALGITNWNNSFDFMVFFGPSPLEVIESSTAFTGRITVPQPWVFAPWNVSIGGSERLREVVATVRKERIPTSAIWAEDWWWDNNQKPIPRSPEWALAKDRYPDYAKVADELHQAGIRLLGYFQPYLFLDSKLYHEAAEKGFLTKNADGSPAIISLTFAKKAQLDVTNPEAVKWWQETLFQKCVDWGVDGWMTDFGEYTPPYSISHDGRDGWALHNEYTVLWAKANREFFDRARPDGDYVFFIRGGYTGVQKYASVMWTGDSNTNWEKYDGLPSTIPAVTSVGISGFPVTATDIAGYHCLTTLPAKKELFIRWAQMGAMLPVMRNHRGVINCKNWKFDDDRETLEAYKKAAVLHTALFPYMYTLVHEAAQKGWPVVRHLMLHYPDDPGSLAEDYQFLMGDRLLVAPVIKKKAREREVYFPPGEWLDFYSGKRYTGPGKAVVNAPLDLIPLFVKAGTMLPLFDSVIDTLVREDRDDLNGWDDADSSMKIIFNGEGKDEFTLWDGTRIQCEKTHSDKGKCSVENAPVERKYTFEFR